MKSAIRNIFRLVTGFELNRTHPVDAMSGKIYSRYSEYTMVSEKLFRENLRLAYDFRHVDGCIVECGVWRGGMIAGIASVMPDRMFYLFDSFEGLPEARPIDGTRALAWQSNKEGKTYHDNCTAEIGFAEDAMRMSGSRHAIVKGWFDATLPEATFESGIALLRLDGDWYDSTMACLSNLFPKVVKGGIVIVDDYYTWDGCSRAVHDYLSSIKSPSRIYRTAEGVPYLIKNE